MNLLIKLFVLSLLAMVLAACGGEGEGLPSQGEGGEPVPTIVSLQVTPATANAPVGFGQQYLALAILDDGSVIDVTANPMVQWTSSDPATASIISGQSSGNGLAKGEKPGTVTITASGTANGTPFSASAQLEVTNAVVTDLQVTPVTATVPAGLEQQFTAVAILSDGSTRNVTNDAALSWTSSDGNTASIISGQSSGNGLAKGEKPGEVTITASGTANGTPFSASAQLEVTNAVVTALQVTPVTATVPAGFERQFTAIAILSDGSTRNVTNDAALSWKSSDPATATIVSHDRSRNGLAKGEKPGEVTITASGTANGTPFSASAQLEVTNAVVTDLQVTPVTATVPDGLEQQFTAIAILSDGSTLPVTNDAALSWTSSDPATASIISGQSSGNGLAKGEKPGKVTITASGTANGTPFSASAQLEVTNAVVTDLQVTPVTATVPDGLEQQFTAVAILSDGSTLPVTNDAALSWTSSDTGIATIVSHDRSRNGLAKGEKPGTVTITASGTANGTPFSASAQLEVTNAVVTDLQVTPVTATVPDGLEQQFTAIAILSDGSTRNVTNDAALSWTSSDPATASIISGQSSGNGLAKGEKPGKVTITASGTANGTPFSASAQLEVTNAVVTDLQVTPVTATVPDGLEQQFTAVAILSDGSTRNVTNDAALSWTSSDTGIATIVSHDRSRNGLAKGEKPGTVTITASGTANGTPFSASAQLEVTNAVVTALQVTPVTATVPDGLEQQFTAVAILSDGSTRNVTNDAALSWTSSDGNTASIISGQSSGNGLAKGEKPGKVTITASGTANGTPFSASAQLEVTNAVVTALRVYPSTPPAIIPKGRELQFRAEATMSDGSKRDLTYNAALSWTSSDTGIATIMGNGDSKSGIAHGESPGNVTITASITSNETLISASDNLEVTDAAMTNLKITPENATVAVGQQMQFDAMATFSDGSTQSVNDSSTIWRSFDTSIATITQGQTSGNGLATGIRAGNAQIKGEVFDSISGYRFSAIANLEVN